MNSGFEVLQVVDCPVETHTKEPGDVCVLEPWQHDVGLSLAETQHVVVVRYRGLGSEVLFGVTGYLTDDDNLLYSINPLGKIPEGRSWPDEPMVSASDHTKYVNAFSGLIRTSVIHCSQAGRGPAATDQLDLVVVLRRLLTQDSAKRLLARILDYMVEHGYWWKTLYVGVLSSLHSMQSIYSEERVVSENASPPVCENHLTFTPAGEYEPAKLFSPNKGYGASWLISGDEVKEMRSEMPFISQLTPTQSSFDPSPCHLVDQWFASHSQAAFGAVLRSSSLKFQLGSFCDQDVTPEEFEATFDSSCRHTASQTSALW